MQPDRTAPSVSITSPASGTSYTFAQTVTINASASDNVGVARVEFYDNGVLRSTDYSAPYSVAWAVSSATNGSHQWTARAYDAYGNVTVSSARTLTVNIATDTQAPSVYISSPGSGTTYSSAQTVSINANASDNVGVTRVEFYDNGVLRATDYTAPYSASWSVTSANNGSHVWTAKAFDAAGRVTTSSAVTLNVNIAGIGGDTTAPTVSITSPAGGANYTTPQSVSINVAATDNVGVTRVEFYDGATLKCSGTGMSCLWSVSSAVNGVHSWTAKAFDAAGNIKSSSPVSLSVNITALAPPSGGGAVQWVDAFGGPSYSDAAVGKATATDASGNIFVAATLAGSGDFNPSAPLFGANFNGNIVLAKYRASGGVLWTRMGVGSASTAMPTGVHVDSLGAVYVAGYFQGSIDFGGGSLVSTGGYSAFLAKFTNDGGHLWSRRYAGTGSIVANAVSSDASGSVYLAGYLQGAGDFGGASANSNGGSRDAFIAKYNATTAALQWVRTYGGTGSDAAAGVDVGPDGQPVITGSFQSSASFGGVTLNSAGGDDVFVAKLSSLGATVWARSYGGPGTDQAAGVGIDGAGSIVIAARFLGTAAFGGTALTSVGDYDIALASFSSAGAHQWSKRFGGPSGDLPLAIAVGSNGQIVITGTALGTLDLGGGYTYQNGSWDIFVAKYSASGAHMWSKRAGKLYDDRGTGVAVDGSGYVALTGVFFQGINFGSGDILNAGGGDGFIARFAP